MATTKKENRIKRKIKKEVGQSYKLLTALFFIILAIGTVFYHLLEGWRWIDSIYFCVISLTTIGYGDIAPTHAASKIFTIFYVMIGIGIIFGFIRTIAKKEMNLRKTPE